MSGAFKALKNAVDAAFAGEAVKERLYRKVNSKIKRDEVNENEKL